MARPGMGERTDDDSTKATDPPGWRASHTSRPIRTAPRNTELKDFSQSSSGVLATVPVGGPPTETSAPSSRPNAWRAVSINRPGVPGSALSATTATAASPRSATAASRDSALRPDSTTRAPSATSASAVARPSPRAPPVTR